MSLTVHYPGNWTACGGPGTTLPVIADAELVLTDAAAAPITTLNHDGKWKVVDSQGNVHAEADNPSELIPWWTEYLEGLGDLYLDGQL